MEQIIIFFAKYLYLIIILIAVIAVGFTNKTVRNSILKLSFLAFPIAFIIAKILNTLFYNPRPFVVEKIQPLIPHAANNGFPSDHTLLTMTIAVIIFSFNQKLGMILAVLSVIVGTARILAHIHHPIDVLGGIAISIISVAFSRYILKKIRIKP